MYSLWNDNSGFFHGWAMRRLRALQHFRTIGLLLLLPAVSAFGQNAGQAAAMGKTAYNEAELNTMLAKPLTLEDCLAIALRKNISLEVARQDLQIAKVGLSGSYANFYPAFSLLGRSIRTNQHRPFDPSDLDDDDPIPQTDFQFDNQVLVASVMQQFITGAELTFSADLRKDVDSPDFFGEAPTTTRDRIFYFEVSQPLLRDGWFTVTKAPITEARYMMKAQEKQHDSVELQTILDVKKAYYTALLQREIIRANEAAINRDSTLMQLSEAKYRASLATRRDVLSAEIQLAEDQASLISSQADYELALDQLKDAMGVPIDAKMSLVEMDLSYSSAPLDENILVQQAIENNPLIAASEFNVKRIELERRLAKNQMLPRLDLNVGYEDKYNKNTDRFAEVTTKDLQVTLNLSYSFLQRDRSTASLAQQAEIALNQERTKLVDVKRQITIDVRRIIRSVRSSVRAIEVLQKSIEAAKEKVRFATTMFNLGRASNLDITDAQQVLLRTEILYLRKITDYHLLLAQLETLIGEPLEL